jgi:hypothetical protein
MEDKNKTRWIQGQREISMESVENQDKQEIYFCITAGALVSFSKSR